MTDKEFIKIFEGSIEKWHNSIKRSSVLNGDLFIQQDPIIIESLKQQMIQHYDPKIGFGILGRYLNDGDSVLYEHWCRLSNCDEQYREWGQGYYRINPNESAKCGNEEFKAEIIRRNRKRKLDQIDGKEIRY